MALLTKEQIKYLEKRLVVLKSTEESLRETISEEAREFKAGSEDPVSSTMYSSQETLLALKREIVEIERLLEEAKVPEYNSEVIAIGTNFTTAMQSNGNITEDKFTLVESNPNYDREDEYTQISINSPLGKAVLGKSVNDVFEYQAPAGVFRGVIVSIEPQRELSEEKEIANQKTIGTHPSMKRGK